VTVAISIGIPKLMQAERQPFVFRALVWLAKVGILQVLC
jgi:hypothetical protein